MMPIRLFLVLLAIALAPLSACMGIDVTSVRRASVDAPASPELALASGRIRFVVDGQPLNYGLLNKPTLQLFHRGRGQLLSSPEVGSDGRFRWQLPPGDYGVAVIHGGMSPARQPHRLPGGSLVFVNGLVDPGIEFTLQPGRHQALGTLVIEVESRAPKDVLFGSERVFGRLREIRVEDDDSGPAFGAQGAPVRAPMRRIERSVAR
ncbi:MAG: hypothetical protein KAY46_11080 [Burkholderiaceae bacterium]|nr:hypothetical protein [Burkholderiaceae bacterium]